MLGRSHHDFFVRADNTKAAAETCKRNGYWNGHEADEPKILVLIAAIQ